MGNGGRFLNAEFWRDSPTPQSILVLPKQGPGPAILFREKSRTVATIKQEKEGRQAGREKY